MNKILKQFANTLIIIILLNAVSSYAQRVIPSSCGSCPINSLCVNPCNVPWVTGSFTTNGRNPILINGKDFGVQRIDAGLYAITFKKPFCCPIAVVASSNVDPTDPEVTLSDPKSFPINFRGAVSSKNPVVLATSFDGRCLITGNAATNNLSSFAVNPVSADLTLIQSGVSVPGTPVIGGLVFSANGCTVATTPDAQKTSFFTTNNCALELPQTIIDNAPQSIEAVAVARTATRAVALVKDPTQTQPYSLLSSDFSSCTLGSPSSITLTDAIKPVAIAAAKNIAAVLDQGSNSIRLFNVATAEIVPQGTPTANSAGTAKATAIAIAPAGDFVAVLNRGSNNLSTFIVRTDATEQVSLKEVAKSPVSIAPGVEPVAIAISPDGSLLAVANQLSNNITLFSIDPVTKRLTQITGSPFNLPPGAMSPTDLQFLAQGTSLAVANGATNNVTTFKLSSPKRLTVQICEAITPGCFVIQLPPEADTCATVSFFATPCT